MQKEIRIQNLDQDMTIHLTRGKNVEGKLASHFHCAYTIGVIERGLVEVIYEGKQAWLKDGAFYVMNPYCIHNIHFLKPTDYRVLTLKTELVKNTIHYFSVESECKQDEQIAKALVAAYEELVSTERNCRQKQMIIKYILAVLENEQVLCSE